MTATLTRWYQFVLQQMAAEAYLDQYFVEGRELELPLRDGNNDRRRLGEEEFRGNTRLTLTQIGTLLSDYSIVDHYASDASGFSATVFRRRVDDAVTGAKAGEYTLSFRSTEYQDPDKGGDWDRDGAGGADGEIFATGFALAQMASMERYFEGLLEGRKADGSVDEALRAFFAFPESRIHVTGYSLGGHLPVKTSALASAISCFAARRGRPPAEAGGPVEPPSR